MVFNLKPVGPKILMILAFIFMAAIVYMAFHNLFKNLI